MSFAVEADEEEKEEKRTMLSFGDFIGNEVAVNTIRSLLVEEKIPHMGFFGPPGHGKTYLAQIIADVTKRKFVLVNSEAVKTAMVFRGLIVHPDNCKYGAIVLLDECHALPKGIQNNLLSVLEAPATLVTSYKDQIMRDKLPDHMTFIFATTHAGAMNEAMLSRLEDIELHEYSHEDKFKMAFNYLTGKRAMSSTSLDMEALYDVAFRARSGRDIVRFCSACIRYMIQHGESRLTLPLVNKVFEMRGIDVNGLSIGERKILQYLAKNGTTGLGTLQDFLHVSKKEIENRIEPHLLRRGFIIRGSGGRLMTPMGFKALKGERVET